MEVPKKIVRLEKWEEIVGILKSFRVDGMNANVCLSTNTDVEIIFPSESVEAFILKNHLEKVKEGAAVAILRTDIPNKPIVVRVL